MNTSWLGNHFVNARRFLFRAIKKIRMQIRISVIRVNKYRKDNMIFQFLISLLQNLYSETVRGNLERCYLRKFPYFLSKY